MRSAILFTWMCVWLPISTFAKDKTQQQLDSLWLVWKNPEKSDTDRLKAIGEYSWDGYIFSQPDSAFYFAKLQYAFATQRNQIKYKAEALNIQGVSYWIRANYDSSLYYYKQAFAIREKINDYKGASALLNNIALLLNEKGDYSGSIKYNYKSLKTREKIADTLGMASSYNNLGVIYHELGDYKTALSFYERAIKLFSPKDNKREIADLLNNIASIYSDQNKYNKSIPIFHQSLSLRKTINDKIGIAQSLNNLGRDFRDFKMYDSAYYYLFQSLDLRNEIKDMSGIASSKSNIAMLYYTTSKYSKAIEYAENAIVIAKQIEDIITIRAVSHILYQSYKKSNRPVEALQMLELYQQMNDSVLNDKNQKELIRNQLQYDFDKKEELIKKDNEIKGLKLKRRTNIIIILLIIAVLSYFVYFLKIRNNKLHASKKATELEHKLLGSQMNTHFTFNAINSIQEFILNNQNDKAHHLLSEFSKLMRMVLTNNRKKIISISDEIEFLKKYILLEEQRIKDKIHFKINNSSQIDLDNVQIPSLLIQPIIENAIWHGLRFQKETKNIELIFSVQSSSLLKIEIKDNGIGFNTTEKINSTASHGLSIVKERIRLLYAKPPKFEFFKVSNNENSIGITAAIIIPIINEFE